MRYKKSGGLQRRPSIWRHSSVSHLVKTCCVHQQDDQTTHDMIVDGSPVTSRRGSKIPASIHCNNMQYRNVATKSARGTEPGHTHTHKSNAQIKARRRLSLPVLVIPRHSSRVACARRPPLQPRLLLVRGRNHSRRAAPRRFCFHRS